MSSKDKDKDSEKERKRRRLIKMSEKAERSNSPVQDARKISLKSDIKHGGGEPNPWIVQQIEEAEVARRDPAHDLAVQKRACQEIRTMMHELKDLKGSSQGSSPAADAKRVHATLQFVTLKKMNRMSHVRCKKAREATNEAKQQIDQRHLQLQNLLYEVSHLQKEINKCLAFQSKDEDISLISVDEFYQQAPAEITKPEITQHDKHEQMLARLDWELEERKRLTEQMEEKQKKREVIAKDMTSKQEYLETLQPKLATILQSTRPVQDYLDMPFDEVREQHHLASHLPRPLYTLYRQSSAYKEACDTNMAVTIEGDVEVAKALGDTIKDLDEEDEDEDENEEQEKSSKKRRRRESLDKGIAKKQRVFKPHPLTVNMTLKCKDDVTLNLTFSYLLNLSITTVKVKLSIPTGSLTYSVSAGELLSASSLLSCLFPDDLGDSSPNPANEYFLARMGMRGLQEYVSDTGLAYHWVQALCGLQFLKTSVSEGAPVVTRPCVDPAISSGNMEKTMERLRRRVHARIALQKQLAALESCTVSVGSQFIKKFPAKISSQLTSWKKITFEDVEAVPHAERAISCGLARPTDLFYTGVVERGSAKMVFHVAIAPDYPAVAPVFIVNLSWQGTPRNNITDEHIGDLEAELNFFYDDLVTRESCDQLLSNQVKRLLMCTDVYLETEAERLNEEGLQTAGGGAGEGTPEFVKEKIFTRLSKGPNRKKPYVFNSQAGFFQQRQ